MPGQIHPVVVRAVLGGLREVAPELLPSDEVVDPLLAIDGAVPLEPYRELLAGVRERGGAWALLASGVALERVTHPFLFVLLNSEHPREVLSKEARLERFIHSRHRVEVIEERPAGLVLEHVSDDEPPRPEEDLASCGQHLVLFEQIGCRGLRVRFPGAASGWVRRGERAVLDGDFARWELAWDELVPTRRPMPGLDELLLEGASDRELIEAPSIVQAVEKVVRRDLGRSWRLVEVADSLERAPRSMQRELSEAGTTFSSELDRIRVDESARLLRGSGLSVTEIGYVCGFADGAHFGRRFRKRFGVPPSRFREQR